MPKGMRVQVPPRALLFLIILILIFQFPMRRLLSNSNRPLHRDQLVKQIGLCINPESFFGVGLLPAVRGQAMHYQRVPPRERD